MATWNTNVPTITNTVSADISDIRENLNEIKSILEGITNGTVGSTEAANFEVDQISATPDYNGTSLTATAAEINTACDGISATASEINQVCDGMPNLTTSTMSGLTLSSGIDDKGNFATISSVQAGDTFIGLVHVYSGTKGGTGGMNQYLVNLDSTATCTLTSGYDSVNMYAYYSAASSIDAAFPIILQVATNGDLILRFQGSSAGSDSTSAAVRLTLLQVINAA